MSQPSTVKTPFIPATDKQVSYLKSLCEKRDNADVIDLALLCMESGVLSKKSASAFIDKLITSPYKKKAPAAAAAYKAQFSPAVQAALAEKVKVHENTGGIVIDNASGLADKVLTATIADFEQQMPVGFIPEPEKPVVVPEPAYGYYKVGNALYCYDEFKTKYGSKIKVMKLQKKQAWSNKLGKYVPKGSWVYWSSKWQAKNLFAGQTVMTVNEAKAQGLALGFCIRCGRTLTDPYSVANGIGPKCITYPGWGPA